MPAWTGRIWRELMRAWRSRSRGTTAPPAHMAKEDSRRQKPVTQNAAAELLDTIRVSSSSEIYARVVAVGSPEHEEALRFQAERFAQVRAARRPSTDLGSYVDAVDIASNQTVRKGVYRTSDTAVRRNGTT